MVGAWRDLRKRGWPSEPAADCVACVCVTCVSVCVCKIPADCVACVCVCVFAKIPELVFLRFPSHFSPRFFLQAGFFPGGGELSP